MAVPAPLIALLCGFVLTGAALVPMALYEPIVASTRIGLNASMSSASFSAMGLGGLVGSMSCWWCHVPGHGTAAPCRDSGWRRGLDLCRLDHRTASVGCVSDRLVINHDLHAHLDRLPDLVPAELQRRCWATYNAQWSGVCDLFDGHKVIGRLSLQSAVARCPADRMCAVGSVVANRRSIQIDSQAETMGTLVVYCDNPFVTKSRSCGCRATGAQGIKGTTSALLNAE